MSTSHRVLLSWPLTPPQKMIWISKVYHQSGGSFPCYKAIICFVIYLGLYYSYFTFEQMHTEWCQREGKIKSMGNVVLFFRSTQYTLKAGQRQDRSYKIQSPPPLCVVHGHGDHRAVSIALLTTVFTVEPRDKLTLCYRALKSWRAAYTHCRVGVVCACAFGTVVCLLNSNKRVYILHHGFICLCHQLLSTHVPVNTPTHPLCHTQMHTHARTHSQGKGLGQHPNCLRSQTRVEDMLINFASPLLCKILIMYLLENNGKLFFNIYT